MNQKGGIRLFLHAENTAPTGTHRCLLNTDGDQRVNDSAMRQWVVDMFIKNVIPSLDRLQIPCMHTCLTFHPATISAYFSFKSLDDLTK